MAIRIAGLTARDAMYTVAPEPDGRVRLVVEVHTGDAHHATARACLLIGQGHAAQVAASNAAFHLRKGRRVTVYGSGLDHLNGRLIVIGCNCIQPDDEIARQHIERAMA